LLLNSRRSRANWIGVAFLGISVLLTIGTLFLAFTGRSLTDLAGFQTFRGGDQDSSNLSLAELSATASADITPSPTLAPPDPIPEDIELTARGVYVLHADSDTVLFEREPDEPLQPASTAKIFTAIVVLEYASPEEVIEINESDIVDPVVESSMGLEAGDRVTVHDLLVGLMLPSGNDAASALSRTIGARIDGDEDEPYDDRFLREMNRVADDLGLEASELRHAAGHDRDDQAVTARELAVATVAMLERPSLATIVAMKRAEIQVGGENARVLTVENTNELLIHDDVYGVKTGTTVEAGQCLVVAQHNGDSTTIAVILGSSDRYGDARTLLDLPEPPEPEEDNDESEDLVPEHTEPVDDPVDPEG
jgi:serine-type D-Ala-D-Ala carboxypeptidase (penicillin-binding protein 5/6)